MEYNLPLSRIQPLPIGSLCNRLYFVEFSSLTRRTIFLIDRFFVSKYGRSGSGYSKISFASRFVLLAIICGRARARRGEKKLEITLEAD